MTAPFKVKAVFVYKSDEPDDLSFDIGQIITVTEDEDADWYSGEYTNAAGQNVAGLFPRNFVEKYEPAVPSRPARAPRKVPQPEPEPEPEPQAAATLPTTRSVAPLPASIPPPSHEPSREAEIAPPKEFSEPAPQPRATAQPRPDPAAIGSTAPLAKKPPPVVDKPTSSSFKDRIAAFNKQAAAPVAPFKPGGAGTTFVKKPFVAPPPSRNAYVPPPRDPPPAKVYRREEELEDERQEAEADGRPPVVSERTVLEEDDQPKPTSLKDRIALLQQQQLEQAQRQAEPTRKKEKPKRPTKQRSESSELRTDADIPEDGAHLERVSTERSRKDPVLAEDEQPLRRSIDEPATVLTPPLPARELVSDTNDADDSGAADTEDPHDISTEEEPSRPRSMQPPPVVAKTDTPAEEDEVGEDDTEEEEDPEMRRKRELRERMAKMSGGMGMMGMFGGGGGGAAPAARKPKPTREDRPSELQEEEETRPAPPVPIMALPGLSNMKQMPKPLAHFDDEDESAQPTPSAAHDIDTRQEDYVSQRPSRHSTDRSQPRSPQETSLYSSQTHQALNDRPQPPQSPGARPVPPPPPPTKYAGELPLAQKMEGSDDDYDAPAMSVPTLPSISTTTPIRAVPPPPPNRQPQSPGTPTISRAVPPVPMSPTSPQSRAPPPPPPGQLPFRRTPTETSLQPPPRDDSEDEVTEYDGDYDTDIAPSAKHKTALKSHNRDTSLDEGALSDDSARQTTNPQSYGVPPPIPTTGPQDVLPPLPQMAPRDIPPAPFQSAPRPRDSVEVPRAAPPPIPPVQTVPRPRESVDVPRAAPPPVPLHQATTRPRDSVDSPRTAPPPLPSTNSPIEEDEYDPYRYSAPSTGIPGMVASLRKPTDESDEDYAQPSYETYQPAERAAPAPPPIERAAPPLPQPTGQAPVYQDPMPTAMSGALSAPTGLGRSNTMSRRSTDVPRPEHGFIAADIDLAQQSMWWSQENNPPPSLLNRNDVLWETESSTTQKRGGRSSVSRDIYVLYQDYSQTTINATFDAAEPSHVSFEQNHQRPPVALRKDQLESASENFGVQIARGAEKALGNTVGEGTAQEFVLSLIRPLTTALLPVGSKSYGALVYANLANASTQQHDEIRAGDIVTFRNAKFGGHKGGLHQKYSMEVGKPDHVAVIIDWDGTKKKIRAWEQGNQEKGKRAKVREESYRMSDLKSGEVRIWRVMPRSYVNWGTA